MFPTGINLKMFLFESKNAKCLPHFYSIIQWLWYFKEAKMPVHFWWYLWKMENWWVPFFSLCKYFTRLLNSESHIQIALSTVLLDLGVTVRNTGKFRGIFLCTTLFPVKYSSRILKDSDSRPNSLLKFMSFLTGKLSNTMLAIQARCRGGTDSTL